MIRAPCSSPSAENMRKPRRDPPHAYLRTQGPRGRKAENSGRRPAWRWGGALGWLRPAAVVPEADKPRGRQLSSQRSWQKPRGSRETGAGAQVGWATLWGPRPGGEVGGGWRRGQLSFPSGICQIPELLRARSQPIKSKRELLSVLHWESTAWTLERDWKGPGQQGRSSVTGPGTASTVRNPECRWVQIREHSSLPPALRPSQTCWAKAVCPLGL